MSSPSNRVSSVLNVYDTKEEAIEFINTLYSNSPFTSNELDELKIKIITEYDEGSKIALDFEYKNLSQWNGKRRRKEYKSE
jgi:hypothetical protein